jgi:hypothetical protein
LIGELEHLKTKTRLIDEKFVSVMGEYDLDVIGTQSILIVIRKVDSLSRVRPTLDLSWEENAARRSGTGTGKTNKKI